MTSPHDLAEPVCARCRRPVCTDTAKIRRNDPRVRVRMRWPEGPVCVRCYTRALDTYGICAGCGVERLLPGLGSCGTPVCTDCAGGLGQFRCPTCGREAALYTRMACAQCVLAARLAVVLDAGDGTVRPELVPFYKAVCAMPRPRRGLVWLAKPHVPPILRALALDEVPLTHDGLDTLRPWRSGLPARTTRQLRRAARSRPVPAVLPALAAALARLHRPAAPAVA
ncbi:hypothetical protein ACSHWB_43440 [Lentzea sp. HUAS TT2]|uniref:hypothetical protein n=1 Tax=Lentzea sp. HUAS TT2 TaxID=3447454 RepID=UPI003F6F30FA